MKLNIRNIFQNIPDRAQTEYFETLLQQEHVKIERIVSEGHTSPESGWYDQQQNEWVIVLQGAATIDFVDGRQAHLVAGDFLNILAHEKHKVSWTNPDKETVWLAVFY